MDKLQLLHFKGIYFAGSDGNIYAQAKNPPRADRKSTRPMLFDGGQWYRRLSAAKVARGYLRIKLPLGPYAVHRIIATAFIPNDRDLPQVNHLDGNKSNNRIDNLEWSTNADNLQHAMALGLRKAINYKRMRDLLENSTISQREIAERCRCSTCSVETFIRESAVKRPSSYSKSLLTNNTRSTLVGTKWYRGECA